MQPDVIGLQEVDNITKRSPFDETAKLASLTGMHGYFVQNRVFQDGGYGVSILSRTEPLEVRYFHYHPPGQPVPDCTVEHSTLADFCQGAIALKLTDSQSGKLFWFVTTHIGLNGMQEPEITELVNEFLPTLKGASAIFVSGDFNSVPDAPEMKPIQSAFTDTWAANGKGDGWTFDSANPYERIDYIFQNPVAFTCDKVEVPVTQASDHRPFYAEFHF